MIEDKNAVRFFDPNQIVFPKTKDPHYKRVGDVAERQSGSDAADDYRKSRRIAVEEYRKRRQARLDAKEEEGRWVTTENDNHVHINAEGVPDKGNPYFTPTKRRWSI